MQYTKKEIHMKNEMKYLIIIFKFFSILILLLPGITIAQDIRIVVRGDDMGMTEGSLEAFERAFNHGVLTSGAIQVPAPWFEAAAELAKKNPGWCVGIHLCLIAEWRGYRWRPVLPWDKVPSLVDEDGFLFGSPAELKANNPQLDEMEAELHAQIELAIKKGINVQYIDTHYSGINRKIVEKLGLEYNLPISGSLGEKRLSGVYMVPENEKKELAVKMLNELKIPGLYLWVCHIGIDSPEQNALIHAAPGDIFLGGGVGKHRAAETDVLTSIEVKSIILKKGIKLVSYRQLWEEQNKK